LIFYVSEHRSKINFQLNKEIRYLHRTKTASITSFIFTAAVMTNINYNPAKIKPPADKNSR